MGMIQGALLGAAQSVAAAASNIQQTKTQYEGLQAQNIQARNTNVMAQAATNQQLKDIETNKQSLSDTRAEQAAQYVATEGQKAEYVKQMKAIQSEPLPVTPKVGKPIKGKKAENWQKQQQKKIDSLGNTIGGLDIDLQRMSQSLDSTEQKLTAAGLQHANASTMLNNLRIEAKQLEDQKGRIDRVLGNRGVNAETSEEGKKHYKLDLQQFGMKQALFDFDKDKDVTFDGKEASDLKPVSYNFDRDETGDEQEAREAYERDRKLPQALFDFDKDQPVLDDEGYQKSTFKPGETKVGNGYKLDLQMFANKEDYDRIKAYLKGLKGFENLDSGTQQAIIRAKGWEYDRLNELRDQYPIEGINSIEDQYEDMKKRNMNISDYGLYVKMKAKKGDK